MYQLFTSDTGIETIKADFAGEPGEERLTDEELLNRAACIAADLAYADLDELVTRVSNDVYKRYHNVAPSPDSIKDIISYFGYGIGTLCDGDQSFEHNLRTAIHAQRLLDVAKGKLT